MTSSQSAQAAVRLLCIDSSRPPTHWEQQQLAAPSDPRAILVLTKCDSSAAADALGPPGAIATSSRTGQGLGALGHAIASAASSQSAESNVVAGTAARCRESLVLAAASLRRAKQAADLGEEFVAAEVRSALDDLARVLGTVYTDDILDRIFSRFCIGK